MLNKLFIIFIVHYVFVGAFVTWRTHMRRVFTDCRVSGVVHTRALRNCAREALQRAALDARLMCVSLGVRVATITTRSCAPYIGALLTSVL